MKSKQIVFSFLYVSVAIFFSPGWLNPKNTLLMPKKHNYLEASKTVKDWNIMVYMANNNNLHRYGIANFKQMVNVGSTGSVNILVQIDEPNAHENYRFFIEYQNPVLLEHAADRPESTSGTPENLYDFIEWGILSFPARYHAVILWNHGSGIKDPDLYDLFGLNHRDEFFDFNYATCALELNRNLWQDSHFMHSCAAFEFERGIAFNHTARTYLNNQDLKKVFANVSQNLLNGDPLDIIAMDACHMAMIEIGSELKQFASYLVASEEIEPSKGYNYSTLIEPFTDGSMLPHEFAQHLVQTYREEYSLAVGDITQSAICLDGIKHLERNFATFVNVAQELILLSNRGKDIIEAIWRARLQTTVFFDKDYFDLGDFYQQLMIQLEAFCETIDIHSTSPQDQFLSQRLKKLYNTLKEGRALLYRTVIDSIHGYRLPKAEGLSFYFPERRIHPSYLRTSFDQVTGWSKLLKTLIEQRPWRLHTALKSVVQSKKHHTTLNQEYIFYHERFCKKPCQSPERLFGVYQKTTKWDCLWRGATHPTQTSKNHWGNR